MVTDTFCLLTSGTGISSDIRYMIIFQRGTQQENSATKRRYLDVPVDSNAWQSERGFVQGMLTASPILLTYREKAVNGPLLHSIAK